MSALIEVRNQIFGRKQLNLPILASLVFLLVYNISFKGAESLSTGRIAISLMLVCVFIFRPPKIPRLPTWFYLLFVPVPYVFVLFLFTGDSGQLSRLIHLGLYSFLGAWCAIRLAGSKERFLVAFLVAAVAQAGIDLFSFLSIDYRRWYEAYVVNSSNFDASYIYRAVGLSGSAGSSLSVIQGLGTMCAWVLLKEANSLEGGRKVWRQATIILAMLLLSLSCIVVGRTGLILSVFFLFLGIIGLGRRAIASFCVGLPVAIYLFGFIVDLDAMLPTNFSTEYFYKWAFGFFFGHDESLQTLNKMPIPPLNLYTTIGTGLSNLANGLNPSGNDSGFIQTYFAMGLPMAIFLYTTYIFVLWRLLDWLPRKFQLLLVVVFFLLEYKEPFLFKYVLMFVLISLYRSVHLGSRENTISGRGAIN